MKRLFVNQSLRGKILITVVIVIFLIATTIFIYFPWRYSTAAVESLKDKALSLAQMTAFAAKSGIEFEDEASVFEAIKALRADKDVVSAFIFNKNKKKIASFGTGQIPEMKGFEQSQFVQEDTLITHFPIGNASNASGLLIVNMSLIRVRQQANEFRFATLVISILVFGIGSLMVLLMLKPILIEVRTFQHEIPKLASGDLTTSFPVMYNDEIGDLLNRFNQIVAAFRYLVDENKKAVFSLLNEAKKVADLSTGIQTDAMEQQAGFDQVSSSYEELNSQVNVVLQHAEQLRIFMDEVSSAMLEIISTSNEVLNNSQVLKKLVDTTFNAIESNLKDFNEIEHKVMVIKDGISTTATATSQIEASILNIKNSTNEGLQLAEQFFKASEDGLKLAVDMKKSSDSLNVFADDMKHKMSNLSQEMQQVVELLNIIYDIADRTNLLSLNAAIIAAQAGEEGKSFGVVASEIKQLAQSTTNQAGQIENAISAILQKTKDMEKAIDEAKLSTSTVQNKAHLTSDSITIINKGAQHSREIALYSSRALTEISEGIGSISRAAYDELEKIQTITGRLEEWVKINNENLKQLQDVLDLTIKVASAMDEQNKSGSQIEKIVSKLEDMAAYLEKSMKEQKNALANITAVVEPFQNMTQEHMQRSKDLGAASDSLQDQAHTLLEAVEKFKT